MAKGRKDTTKERPSSPSSAKKSAGGKSVAASLVLNRSKQVPAEDTAAFGPIAERFRRAGDLERAVALCKEGLQKFPEHLSARVTLGWALLDLGRYDEAFEALQQVLKRAPDNLAAIRGMAELHERAENAVELPLDGPGPWPPDADAIEASAASTEEDEIEKALAAAGLADRTAPVSAPAASAVIPPATPIAPTSPTPAASSHPAGEIDLAHSATDSLRELEPFMPATPVVAEPQKPVAPPPLAASTPLPVAPPVEEAPVLLGSNGMPMASAPVEAEPFVAHAPVLEPVMDEEVVPGTTNFSKTEPLEAVIDDEIAPVEMGAEPFTAESVEISSAAAPEEESLDAFRLFPTPEFLATAEENVDPLLEAELVVAADGPSLDFEAEPVVDLGGYELTPSPILDAAANLDAALADEPVPVAVDPGPALDFDAPVSAARAEDDFALTPAPILDESAAPEIVIDQEVGELSLGTDDQSLSLDFDAPEAVAEVAEPPADVVEVVEVVEVAAIDVAAAPEPVVEVPPAPVEARVTPVLRSLTPPAQDPDPANDGSESLDVLSIVPPVLESKRKPLDKPAVRKTARRPPKSLAALEGMLRGIAVRRIEMADEHNQYNQRV